MGIAVEDRERIFEKFYRGRHGATLAVRGTGLGLAVARQLVEAHGGTIGVRSTVGYGSTFWVRLAIPGEQRMAHEPRSIEAEAWAISA
jgi:signal transduction histidine kinase